MGRVPIAESTPMTKDHISAYWEIGRFQNADVDLAQECALSIVYNGLNHTVMMVTPDDLEDMVIGFTRSQGWILEAKEIYDIAIKKQSASFIAEVELSSRAFWRLKQEKRHMAGQTGCGLCGVEALSQALPELTVLTPAPLPSAESMMGLRERLFNGQKMAKRSGAMHAAAYVAPNGEIQLCREDIGRHNALDKLGGAYMRHQTNPELSKVELVRGGFQGFFVVSSRCSLELIIKAIRFGCSTLVSLSAPTQLSVSYARQHHLNLIHLPHQSKARVYSPVLTNSNSIRKEQIT